MSLKGTIVGHTGDGFYSVDVQYSTYYADSKLAYITSRLAEITTQIDSIENTQLPELDSELNAAQAELSSAISDNNLNPTVENEKKVVNATSKVMPLIYEKESLITQVEAYELEQAELTKEQSKLQAERIESQTVTIPCADYADGVEAPLLSGDVTILAWGGNPAWGMTLTPSYPSGGVSLEGLKYWGVMDQNPDTGIAYNWTVYPALQRWQSRYRKATITYIDHCSTQKASVAMEPTGLYPESMIPESYEDVPFTYHDWGHKAFKVGDEVIVQMILDGDNTRPLKIIGFANGPQKCSTDALISSTGCCVDPAASWGSSWISGGNADLTTNHSTGCPVSPCSGYPDGKYRQPESQHSSTPLKGSCTTTRIASGASFRIEVSNARGSNEVDIAWQAGQDECNEPILQDWQRTSTTDLHSATYVSIDANPEYGEMLLADFDWGTHFVSSGTLGTSVSHGAGYLNFWSEGTQVTSACLGGGFSSIGLYVRTNCFQSSCIEEVTPYSSKPNEDQGCNLGSTTINIVTKFQGDIFDLRAEPCAITTVNCFDFENSGSTESIVENESFGTSITVPRLDTYIPYGGYSEGRHINYATAATVATADGCL